MYYVSTTHSICFNISRILSGCVSGCICNVSCIWYILDIDKPSFPIIGVSENESIF